MSNLPENDERNDCWPPADTAASATEELKSEDDEQQKPWLEHQDLNSVHKIGSPAHVVHESPTLERTSHPHFARFVKRENQLEVQCSRGLKPGIEAILTNCQDALSSFTQDRGDYLQGETGIDVLNQLYDVVNPFPDSSGQGNSSALRVDVSQYLSTPLVDCSGSGKLSTAQQKRLVKVELPDGSLLVRENEQPTVIKPGPPGVTPLSLMVSDPAQIRMHFKINDTAARRRFYKVKCHELQVKALKTVLKIIIKCIVDKKQSKYPYNGGKLAKTVGYVVDDDGGVRTRGDITRPPWWPTFVRHVEPDHLRKEELHDLFAFFMDTLGSPAVAEEKGKVTIAKLEAEFTKASVELTKQKTGWQDIVVSVLSIRKKVQDIEDGVTTCIRVMQPEVSRDALLKTFPEEEESETEDDGDAIGSPDVVADESPGKVEEDVDPSTVEASDDDDDATVEDVIDTIDRDVRSFHGKLVRNPHSDDQDFSRLAQADQKAAHGPLNAGQHLASQYNSFLNPSLTGNAAAGSQQHLLPSQDYLGPPYVALPPFWSPTSPVDTGSLVPIEQASSFSSTALSSSPSQIPYHRKRKRGLVEVPDSANDGETPVHSYQESSSQAREIEDEKTYHVPFQSMAQFSTGFGTPDAIAQQSAALSALAPKWMASYENYAIHSQLASHSLFGVPANTYDPLPAVSVSQSFPSYFVNYGALDPDTGVVQGFAGQITRPKTSHMMRTFQSQGNLESLAGQWETALDALGNPVGNYSLYHDYYAQKRCCHRECDD